MILSFDNNFFVIQGVKIKQKEEHKKIEKCKDANSTGTKASGDTSKENGMEPCLQ
jgi:hypothetical protein